MPVPSDLPVVAFVDSERIARAPLHRALPVLQAAAATMVGRAGVPSETVRTS